MKKDINIEYIVDTMDEGHLKTRKDMITTGENPYPPKFERTTTISNLTEVQYTNFKIGGRIVQKSIENNREYFEVNDGSGSVLVEIPDITNAQIGDIIQVTSNKYDGRINSPEIKVITKSVVELPDKKQWKKKDSEFQKKHRDIGMIIDSDLKQTFIDRSRINSLIREFYSNRGFVEVETPFLVTYPEIAPVRPFTVEDPKFSQKTDLRLTNTEYIRRLMVAGFEKVYQLGKCFRDEPASFKHQPEFTQLTFGIAYEDYKSLMNNIEQLVYSLAIEIKERAIIKYKEKEIDLTPPWNQITVRDSLIEYTGIDIQRFNDPKELRKEIIKSGFSATEEYEYGGFLMMATLVDNLVEENVFDKLIQPTFLCEYPYYLGGPAKELDNDPNYKKRSEVFIAGVELANISTPQNDPLKIRKWYNETLKLKQENGWKNQRLDEPYLHAIDQGIPICTTGGLGVDRLMMFLLEKDKVEDVTLFPWREYKTGGYKNE